MTAFLAWAILAFLRVVSVAAMVFLTAVMVANMIDEMEKNHGN